MREKCGTEAANYVVELIDVRVTRKEGVACQHLHKQASQRPNVHRLAIRTQKEAWERRGKGEGGPLAMSLLMGVPCCSWDPPPEALASGTNVWLHSL